MIVLTSPGNPTGGVFTPDDLEQIAWWADRRDVLIFSDEAFECYQYEGNPATIRSDIYALGIIFHEMLTRKRPFEAESVSELIALHISAPRPKLPETLADCQKLLDRMLAVDPRERYKSADELLYAVDEVWTQQALRTLQKDG